MQKFGCTANFFELPVETYDSLPVIQVSLSGQILIRTLPTWVPLLNLALAPLISAVAKS